MALEQLVLLALIQGITEFLPISSSAHLILLPMLTDWPDQGPIIDIAIHMGSLFAVVIYFREETIRIFAGAWTIAQGRHDANSKLFMHLLLGTIPVVIAGFFVFWLDLSPHLRSAKVIVWSTLIFGVVLWIADMASKTQRRMDQMAVPDALWIGLAQILALIPGTSRSGITITAARFLGYGRSEAARFSMLLSIPTILGAGALAGIDLYRQGSTVLRLDAAISATLSFLAAFATIWLFMRALEHVTLLPFVLYRLALGSALLVWIYL